MADMSYQGESRPVYRGSSMDWGAVWAGLFTFLAIWSVFGALGFAIFAGATPAVAGHAGAGTGVGMGIWIVVLTIIAMWVAGQQTGKLAGLDGRFEAASHGMVMFGLGVAAVVVLTMSGGLLFSNGGGAVHDTALLTSSGWVGFFALFLGWLAAISGAVSGIKPKTAMLNNNVRDIRTAA